MKVEKEVLYKEEVPKAKPEVQKYQKGMIKGAKEQIMFQIFK